MKILVIDNYDSFTYNLVQLLRENSEAEISVFRNDEISLEAVNFYDKIILSPGPGIPRETGVLCPLIHQYKKTKPILGVCLGMQAIGEVFGAKLINMEHPLHGVSTGIFHNSHYLLKDVPAKFEAARYHSWVLQKNSISPEFVVTAVDEAQEPMAIEHRELPIYGVQFHPESILTEFGKNIVSNFLNSEK
ncbi:MAG TPA: aminodeoxychorismate/anthranilate synthase component II [Flavobacteriaceae bacterium]|nr:aminodeoxychorismate/anthranilate synthase component II [Flavobacteriaceae bacterium]